MAFPTKSFWVQPVQFKFGGFSSVLALLHKLSNTRLSSPFLLSFQGKVFRRMFSNSQAVSSSYRQSSASSPFIKGLSWFKQPVLKHIKYYVLQAQLFAATPLRRVQDAEAPSSLHFLPCLVHGKIPKQSPGPQRGAGCRDEESR